MEEFEAIAEEAIQKAENVKCSVEQFEAGLVIVYLKIKERLEMDEIDPSDQDILDQIQ